MSKNMRFFDMMSRSVEALTPAGSVRRGHVNSWKTTDSFGRDELPLVEKVADLVHRWIHANGRQELVSE
jgi:hypothetical protein